MIRERFTSRVTLSPPDRIDVSYTEGPFSYLNRFAVRSLVLRGYRQALRVLADAKEKGVFERTSKLTSPLN